MMGTAVALALDEQADELALVLGRLDERQRRWVTGLLASMLPRGGIAQVARAAGLDEKTVARGKAEVEAGLEGFPDDGRVRRPGGGRPPLEKSRPTSISRSKMSSSLKPAAILKDVSAMSEAV